MHCIYLECVNITNSPGADAGRLLVQNGALSQYGTNPVVTVFGLLYVFFMLSVIDKLFEVNVTTCEIKVSDETHKIVMLTIIGLTPIYKA